MSEKEFVSVVFDSRILNFGEISELMKYYNDVELTSPLPFIHTPRAGSIKLHQLTCNRFSVYKSPGVNAGWSYHESPDRIVLSVNKAVISCMAFNILAVKVASTQFLQKLTIPQMGFHW